VRGRSVAPQLSKNISLFACNCWRELGVSLLCAAKLKFESAGPVTLRAIDRDEDVYGRKLRLVFVNGVSVGDTLAGEDLARHYAGGRRPWC
jgi:micrococcal nuclease